MKEVIIFFLVPVLTLMGLMCFIPCPTETLCASSTNNVVITSYTTDQLYSDESPQGHIVMDAQYAPTSIQQFGDCLVQAKAKMYRQGWTQYHKEILDCEDYAMRLAGGIRFEYATRYNTHELGVPVGACSYLEGGDPKRGHAVIFVVIDGKRLYFQPYPWDKNEAITMTKEELKTVRTLYF